MNCVIYVGYLKIAGVIRVVKCGKLQWHGYVARMDIT
jgi:hypothetical protein